MIAAVAAALAGGTYYAMRSVGGTSTSGTGSATAPAQGEAMVEVTLPDELSEKAQMGQQAFDAVCAECHGKNAAGKMGNGPPLIHKIYEPSHHADMAFQLAVQNGVTAHHWKFGDMPAQDGLTKGDVDAIVAYVREIQQVNGIN
ncbi:MAG: c-type cytochrome [Pseudomonadota bacterium]|nr:cytochrome c [Roseovarius sp. EGI FJ00037]MCZ0812503.1 cytochrome c [Roseovarius sp. EGI FJ00037]